MDLENFDNIQDEDLDPELATPLVELKGDEIFMKRQKDNIFAFIEIMDKYPKLFQIIEKYIISFPSTWLVKAAFSAVTQIFTKSRNRLQIDKRGDLHLKLNSHFNVDIDKLCSSIQPQGSH